MIRVHVEVVRSIRNAVVNKKVCFGKMKGVL